MHRTCMAMPDGLLSLPDPNCPPALAQVQDAGHCAQPRRQADPQTEGCLRQRWPSTWDGAGSPASLHACGPCQRKPANAAAPHLHMLLSLSGLACNDRLVFQAEAVQCQAGLAVGEHYLAAQPTRQHHMAACLLPLLPANCQLAVAAAFGSNGAVGSHCVALGKECAGVCMKAGGASIEGGIPVQNRANTRGLCGSDRIKRTRAAFSAAA